MLESKSGKWTSFSFDFEYSGKTVVEFVTTGRLIIDDVAIVKNKENNPGTGLTEINKSSDNIHPRIYNMMGQCVGNNAASLSNGVYIKDGKKFLISK